MEYYSGIKKEWTIYTCNVMNESQKTYWINKIDTKREHTLWFCLYGILEWPTLVLSGVMKMFYVLMGCTVHGYTPFFVID